MSEPRAADEAVPEPEDEDEDDFDEDDLDDDDEEVSPRYAGDGVRQRGVLLERLRRKSGREQVRVVLDRWSGALYLSLRIWYFATKSRLFFPTKVGVTVRRHEIPRMIAALQQAQQKMAEDEASTLDGERDLDDLDPEGDETGGFSG